ALPQVADDSVPRASHNPPRRAQAGPATLRSGIATVGRADRGASMTTEPRVQAERRIRSLEDRLARLESMLVTYWCLGVGAVLTAGLVLPYGTEERLDAEPVSWSVLSTPFNTVREGAASDSGPGVEGVLFLVGFTGLLLV